MDVTISVVSGGGKKANRVSHSYTLKEVVLPEQVIDMFKTEFKQFFPNQSRLDSRKKE